MFQHIHSHAVNNDNKEFTGIFIEGLGTVRACIECGALIAGGVTRCNYCVEKRYYSYWYKLLLKLVPGRARLKLMNWRGNKSVTNE